MLPGAFSNKEYYKDPIYFDLFSWQAITLQSSFRLPGKSSLSCFKHFYAISL